MALAELLEKNKEKAVLHDGFGPNVQGGTGVGAVNNLPIAPAVTSTKTSSTGSTASGTTAADYNDMLQAAIAAQRQAALNQQIQALDAQLNRGLADYDAQIKALDPVYQGYRNQSEVERYKAQRSLRESQANRGALDSGVGRQEMLNLNTNYGNNLNAINLQYQAEVDALNRAKQALTDEANLQKAQLTSETEIAGLQDRIDALKGSIANQSLASRSAASGVVDKAKSLSAAGSAYNNAFANYKNSFGKGLTAYDIQESLRQGYNNGTLTEDDIRIIKANYGL